MSERNLVIVFAVFPGVTQLDFTGPHQVFSSLPGSEVIVASVAGGTIESSGGLTFAGDGKLYYVASRWRDPKYNPVPAPHKEMEGVVWRLDPVTLKREEVTTLEHPTGLAQYVSRGAVDHNGDLFFGHVGNRPSGIFKVSMPADRKKPNAHLPIRMWG